MLALVVRMTSSAGSRPSGGRQAKLSSGPGALGVPTAQQAAQTRCGAKLRGTAAQRAEAAARRGTALAGQTSTGQKILLSKQEISLDRRTVTKTCQKSIIKRRD